MRQNEHLPGDQAEVVFADHCVQWLSDNLNKNDRAEVFDSIVALFRNPHGKHRLSNKNDTKLAGCNTVEAAERELRVVYQAQVVNGVGLIEILAVGHRRDSEVYDMAHALVSTGKLSDEEIAQIWDALNLLEDTRSRLGLEDWDYFEGPAPDGMVKAVVAAGLLDASTARLLSPDELTAAMSAGWDSDGMPDPEQALQAAMSRVASSAHPERVFEARTAKACGAFMPRSHAQCIRTAGHPGAHRSVR